MRASRTYGSVRGAPSNGRSYRDRDAVATVVDEGVVRVTFNIDELDLTFDKMSTITMLVIEAANNSQKHVFQHGYGSHLAISLQALPNDRALLTIRDDGQGKSEVANATSAEQGLGMHIIEGLVTEMRGTLKIRYASGMEIAVEFLLGR
jgi:two-component sensor histidine kinase